MGDAVGNADIAPVTQPPEHEQVAQADPDMHGIGHPQPFARLALFREVEGVDRMHHEDIALENVAMAEDDGIVAPPHGQRGGDREPRHDDEPPDVAQRPPGRDPRQPGRDALDGRTAAAPPDRARHDGIRDPDAIERPGKLPGDGFSPARRPELLDDLDDFEHATLPVSARK